MQQFFRDVPLPTRSAPELPFGQPGPAEFSDAEVYLGLKEPRMGEPYPQLTNADQHLFRSHLERRLNSQLETKNAKVTVTDNLRTMLSIKKSSNAVTFRLHHMFITAPLSVIRAVARYSELQCRDSAEFIRQFVDLHETQIREPLKVRRVCLDVVGTTHDLRSIYDELNEHYFNGKVAAKITWGARRKPKGGRESIKLGTYTVEDELIRIHRVLDHPFVPRYFVKWIVYHEMLHELFEIPVVDGRRVFHTDEFRLAETEYEEHTAAVLWERSNGHFLLNG